MTHPNITLTHTDGTTTTYPNTHYWNVGPSGALTIYNTHDEPTHTIAPGQWARVEQHTPTTKHTPHKEPNNHTNKVATALDEFITAWKKGLEAQ